MRGQIWTPLTPPPPSLIILVNFFFANIREFDYSRILHSRETFAYIEFTSENGMHRKFKSLRISRRSARNSRHKEPCNGEMFTRSPVAPMLAEPDISQPRWLLYFWYEFRLADLVMWYSEFRKSTEALWNWQKEYMYTKWIVKIGVDSLHLAYI